MSKLADIFRPKTQEGDGGGVVVPMPRVSAKAHGAGKPVAREAVVDRGAMRDLEVQSQARRAVVHRSDESEALHRLLVETHRKIDDLDTLKSTLDDMTLPFRGAMRALDQERALSTHLSRQLGEKAAACDKLRDELQHAENETRVLETEAENLRDALDQARQSGYALEGTHELLKDEIKRRDEKIAALERLIDQEVAQRRSLTETCRTVQEQALQAEARMTEMQEALAEAGQACEALRQDKRSLWRTAEQAREEAERVGRRVSEGEGMLRAIRIELGKVESRYTEVCAERNRLADSVDSLRDQHESERQRLAGRIEALEARAAAAEREVAELRQRLIERTEEARSFICKAAEATIARATAERKLVSVQVSQGLRGRGDDNPTASRTALSEFLRALNLKSREMALAGAAEKLAARSKRQGPSTTRGQSPRASAELHPEDWVTGLPADHQQRGAIEDALNAARKTTARLESEVASLRAGLDDAGEPPSSQTGIARNGTLAYEAGLVAQLRQPREEDDPPRSVA